MCFQNRFGNAEGCDSIPRSRIYIEFFTWRGNEQRWLIDELIIIAEDWTAWVREPDGVHVFGCRSGVGCVTTAREVRKQDLACLDLFNGGVGIIFTELTKVDIPGDNHCGKFFKTCECLEKQ